MNTKLQDLIKQRQHLKAELANFKLNAEKEIEFYRENIKRIQANIDYEVGKNKEKG